MGLHEVPGYLEPLDLELVLLLSVAVPGVAVMITDPVLYSKGVHLYLTVQWRYKLNAVQVYTCVHSALYKAGSVQVYTHLWPYWPTQPTTSLPFSHPAHT